LTNLPSHSRRLAWYALLFPLFLLGAKEGEGCDCKRSPTDDNPIEEVDVDEVADVAEKLQLVMMSPSYTDADKAFSARLDGAGFSEGLKIMIGHTPTDAVLATDVTLSGSNSIQLTVPALAAGSYDVVVENPGGKKAVLRRGLVLRDARPELLECNFVRIIFDTNEDGLVGRGRATLDSHAECLAQRDKVVIEGHADERGTTSYNLGLGQRRAHTVSRALVGAGVQSHKQTIVSYGEERPIDMGHTEGLWAKNRRVDIHAE